MKQDLIFNWSNPVPNNPDDKSIPCIELRKNWLNVYVLKESYDFIMNELSNTKFNAKTKESACKLYFYILYENKLGITSLLHDVMRTQISVSEHTLKDIISCLKDKELISENDKNSKKLYAQTLKRSAYDYTAKLLDVSQSCTSKLGVKENCVKLRFDTIEHVLTADKKDKNDKKDKKQKEQNVEKYERVYINRAFIKSLLVNKELVPSLNTDPKISERIDWDIDFDIVITLDNPYPQPTLTPPEFIPPYLNKLNAVPALDMKVTPNIRKWYNNHDNEPTFGDRIYYAFVNTSKELRKYITLFGVFLVEGYDVHNCFFVLMCFYFKDNPFIPHEEYERYRDLVVSGKFYEDVQAYGKNYYHQKYEKEQDLSFIFKEDSMTRDKVKTDLQSFRNSTASERRRPGWKDSTTGRWVSRDLSYIDAYFREKFPNIFKYLDNWERVPKTDNQRGTSKRLQSDISRIETRIMSRITRDLYKLGYHPVQLHDGIFVPKNEKTEEFNTAIQNLFDIYLFNQL